MLQWLLLHNLHRSLRATSDPGAHTGSARMTNKMISTQACVVHSTAAITTCRWYTRTHGYEQEVSPHQAFSRAHCGPEYCTIHSTENG